MVQIADDDIVYRRYQRENPNATKLRPDGTFRLTSFALKPRPGEQGVSVSLKKLTSAAKMLALVAELKQDFGVAELRVVDIRSLGLEVVYAPTAEDPGHCEIRGPHGSSAQTVKSSRWSMLAEQTRLLSDVELTEQ